MGVGSFGGGTIVIPYWGVRPRAPGSGSRVGDSEFKVQGLSYVRGADLARFRV